MPDPTTQTVKNPVTRWILFFFVFFICQGLIRFGLVSLIQWLDKFLAIGNSFWELWGKLDFLGSFFSLMIITIIFYLIAFIFIMANEICPKPKLAAQISLGFIMFLLISGVIMFILGYYQSRPMAITTMIADTMITLAASMALKKQN